MINLARRILKGINNLSNIISGNSIYVDKNKLQLITDTFRNFNFNSFADLGGVWKVNAAYTLFTLKKFKIERSFIVDTDFNIKADQKLAVFHNVLKIHGDFSKDEVIQKIAKVDAVFLFDVLLHQANPDWDEILTKYSKITGCFIIYNQQWIASDVTFRLTNLELEEYKKIMPWQRDSLFEYVYDHKSEINEKHNKPWKDIHSIFQWAISDKDLRKKMRDLGYKEFFYKNYGSFSNSKSFENHAFVFINNNANTRN